MPIPYCMILEEVDGENMQIDVDGSQNALYADSQSPKNEQKNKVFGKETIEVNPMDLNISKMRKEDLKALPVSEQFLIKSIEKANKAVLGLNTRFEFSIHDKTKEIMVKVLNADTGDLIREIPSEKILDMIAGIWQAVGLFVDEKR